MLILQKSIKIRLKSSCCKIVCGLSLLILCQCSHRVEPKEGESYAGFKPYRKPIPEDYDRSMAETLDPNKVPRQINPEKLGNDGNQCAPALVSKNSTFGHTKLSPSVRCHDDQSNAAFQLSH